MKKTASQVQLMRGRGGVAGGVARCPPCADEGIRDRWGSALTRSRCQNRSALARPDSVQGYLDALGARTPAPASGSGAAVAGAIGAALAELAARFSDEDEVAGRLVELRA